MERIENSLLKLQHLQEEHQHRYKYVSKYAKGIVVDCACGIGYSAEIILSNPAVSEYRGIDVDKEAIDYAREIQRERASFNYGSILALPFEDKSIDTFISLETLEHLDNPALALKEIKRVLKNDGIFICSVPTKEYEAICVEQYGPNPFHLQTFTLEEFNSLLSSEFKYIDIAVIAQEVVSVVHSLSKPMGTVSVFEPENSKQVHGSFIAISSNSTTVDNISCIYTGMSRVEYDKEVVTPIRQSLLFAEDLATTRWKLLLNAERICDERLELINNMKIRNKAIHLWRKILSFVTK